MINLLQTEGTQSSGHHHALDGELVYKITRNKNLAGTRLNLSSGLCGYVAKLGRPVVIAQPSSDWCARPAVCTCYVSGC